MSMFKVDIGVGNMEGGDPAPVRSIVDTRAAHSMLPERCSPGWALRPAVSWA